MADPIKVIREQLDRLESAQAGKKALPPKFNPAAYAIGLIILEHITDPAVLIERCQVNKSTFYRNKRWGKVRDLLNIGANSKADFRHKSDEYGYEDE